MKRAIILAAVGMAAVPSVAEERRELGAHEHGHSVLNIAIEDDRIEMELIAPGMDIAGFEHAAETDQQKAALAQAEAALAEPLELFGLPAAAGCITESASVELEAEEHHPETDHEEEEEGHTEFHASYAITCASPGHLGRITFAYFDRFPGAEEIEVTVITENGQTRYQVDRDAPRIDLKGLI